MKHFARIATLDQAPILAALVALQTPFADGAWRSAVRHTPHQDSDTLEIIGPPTHKPRDLIESLDLVPTQFFDVPAFRECVAAIADMTHGKPARAMLIALRPGGLVQQHADGGAYAYATERYHLALQTNAQSVMVVEDESAFFGCGELWWLDKHARHSACNLGDFPRIHMVVDMWKDPA